MAQLEQWRRVASTFRRTFSFPTNARHSWFPGHMHKGMRQMQRALAKTDCIVEVHDARIPLSGRNVRFRQHLIGTRPHILVLNKEDRVDHSEKTRIRKQVMARDRALTDVIFTCCTDDKCSGVARVLPRAVELIQGTDRYHRTANPESNVLVIGIPNVGKSSLINMLRARTLRVKGKATPVGNKPGVTRAVLTSIRVSNHPLVYLIDTPGVMMPSIDDMHVGLKLALCSTLNDHQVGLTYMADYLLYHLNQTENFAYVSLLKLDEPMDDIRLVLAKSAIYQGLLAKRRNLETGQLQNYPDINRAAELFIEAFRKGDLGRINLDAKLLGR